MAVEGLTSYRYKGDYGWIMIGAQDDADAVNEAGRSLSMSKPTREKLEVWNGKRYVKVKS